MTNYLDMYVEFDELRQKLEEDAEHTKSFDNRVDLIKIKSRSIQMISDKLMALGNELQKKYDENRAKMKTMRASNQHGTTEYRRLLDEVLWIGKIQVQYAEVLEEACA